MSPERYSLYKLVKNQTRFGKKREKTLLLCPGVYAYSWPYTQNTPEEQ